ncbi:alpha/beta hydrolase [Scopulibacillus cellulosilyticus]|uniref:Alpha/beta hydrolase n=1 Tax=Scopulibacillus cellulosilyticus TaxID=2665665 RepID=A0ABW2PZ41_9BACL
MPLDPQVQMVLDHLSAMGGLSLTNLTPEEARKGMVLGSPDENAEPVKLVKDRNIPGPAGSIPIRIYYPMKEQDTYPALVYYHGGGWVIGDIDSHDNICRSLTNLAECVTISVDYRLAPENKFPAAVDDAYAALKWVYDNHIELQIDPKKIAAGGDSAGGNLTAVVSYLAKERKTPDLIYQVLFYPATNFQADTESIRENSEGYFLTFEAMTWFKNHYLNNREEESHPLASPLLNENLSGLPPALVITAEYDPLRDEGEQYAEKLKSAGVEVSCTRYPGVIHGFISMADVIDKGKEALIETGAALTKAFNTK